MTRPPHLDDPALGDVAAWDRCFQPGGTWERNGGRRQTRLYARSFCSRVTFSRTESFSLLDFGCALGVGLRVFHALYPRARLYGQDISPLAVARAQEKLGPAAALSAGDLAALKGDYDVIYTSHVLEHFPDYREAARRLLAHGRRLCVVVPFEEMLNGQPLQPGRRRQHQHSFFRESFDFLVQENLAARANVHLTCCPGARVFRKALFRSLENAVRKWTGKPPRDLNVIYDIQATPNTLPRSDATIAHRDPALRPE
jgi:SAM-dependent methyltransferase